MTSFDLPKTGRVRPRRWIAAAGLLVALFVPLFVSAACCANVVRHAGAPTGRMELPLSGAYQATLHVQEAGSVDWVMVAESADGGFRANSRPGALSDVAGFWKGLLASFFARDTHPGGTLIQWSSSLPTDGEVGRGAIRTPIAAWRTRLKSPGEPIELLDNEDRRQGFLTLAPGAPGAPDPSRRQALVDRVDALLKERLFDESTWSAPGVRSFVEKLRGHAESAHDDVEFLFGAHIARSGVKISHLALTRELDPAFRDRLSEAATSPAAPQNWTRLFRSCGRQRRAD